jgi:hypothetical protein
MMLLTLRSRASAFESLKPKAYDRGHIDHYSSVGLCVFFVRVVTTVCAEYLSSMQCYCKQLTVVCADTFQLYAV